ncbi:hypothetical protein GGTG_05290 [Gaeumannomyces tritici R3-111a-1]|uniref:NAD-dependent epimerase/dehydratase domain-containing protein n=1 Tax=Gaeumannomyces tritici (strain R3-111a-1) TaxID=644352 RepID=J3NVH5_GAET3|nr:hypothetical protein GGTG_05290 [Gaeumannomyces tritici R3-111a-1]EJT75353.1 hypothetical protein GGTG_05290 [Gaeumannomyces tritici R3-111a-1]
MTKGLVLLTGLNGYIAAQTAAALLAAGYSVRGSVRKSASAAQVVAALSKYGDRLEVIEVPDITAPGAFDEAVKGVSAVAHLATPVSLSFDDPEPVLRTAVEGTTRVLESSAGEPSIRSFVVMSSIAAIFGPKPDGHVFTEADWNATSEALVASQGKGAPGLHIYAASKVAAERAFWKFRDEKKPGFTMTAINPVFVAGPPLVTPTTPEQISGTVSWVYHLLAGRKMSTVFPGGGFADVRDVARMVVFGIDQAEKADGERYLVSGSFGTPQAAVDVLRRAYPDRRDVIEVGTPGEGYNADYSYPSSSIYNSSKAVKATGQPFIGYGKMVLDSAKAFEGLL